MLVGRGAEQARIDRLLEHAKAGISEALIVRGEPGIGKSALLRYAANHAEGMTVLTATGVESESDLPFSGLAELLQPVLQLLSEIPAPQAKALAGALSVGPPTAGEPFTVYTGAHSLLTVAAEQRPLVMIVDDAHWLDSASRQALFFSVRRLHADCAAIIFGFRDGEGPDFRPAGVEELALYGLGEQQAKELIMFAAAEPVTSAVAQRLATATRGNPLGILESLKVLSSDQLAGRADLTEPLPAGPEIQQSFARRMAGLTPNTRTALLLAAASHSGAINALRRGCGHLGVSLNAFDVAETIGLIDNDGLRIAFCHPLMRSAVYYGASSSQRRAVHAALAAELDEPSLVSERAWHLAAAVQGEDEEVAEAVEAAAVEARRRAGHAAAAKLFERAARLSAEAEERARRLHEAGNDAYVSGQGQWAIALLDEALSLAEDGILRADISLSRARLEMWLGSPAAARRILLAAADEVEKIDPGRASLMLVDATTTALQEGDELGGVKDGMVETAFRVSERAYRLGVLAGGVAETASAGAYGKMLVATQRHEEGRGLLLQSVDGIDERESIWLAVQLIQYAAMFMYFEEFDRVRLPLERLIARARNSSAPGALPYALGHLAELDFRAGRWLQAEAEAAEAAALAAELEHRISLIFALAQLSWVQAARGQETECRSNLQHLLAVSEHARTAAGAYVARVGGLLALGLGRQDEAIAALRPLFDALHRAGLVVPSLFQETPDLIEAYVHVGRLEDALTVLGAMEVAAQRSPGNWPLAVAARCRGLLADDFEAHFEAALRLHDRASMPFERARTALCFGERLRRAKRRLDAREQLRDALRTFDQLGAEPWANRTRNELVAAGEQVHGGSRAGHVLTAQELQVALKVAEGATNRETAATLFMSSKTVEAHLSRIYSKLGIRSRTELAYRFADAGARPVAAGAAEE